MGRGPSWAWRSWAWIGRLTLAAGAAAASSAGAATSAPPAWVELTAQGPEIRTIAAPNAACPSVTIDGRETPMRLRTAADPAFPAVCVAPAPSAARDIQLDGRRLPMPAREIRRIVLLGDTGCRLKGDKVQACNDPDAWPFAEVALRAAARRPDLVIHVGDYYYRETPCPAGDARCAGSPSGDTWETWRAEFFTPAAPLLEAAPWVFVRGNHESCSRGGPGWFRLLDAAARPKACPAASDPFVVGIGGLNLYVLDSANTVDRAAPAKAVAAFSDQLDALAPDLAHAPGWIVTHRPIWGLVPVARIGPIGPLNLAINATEQAAVKGHDLDAVQMVVSGHIHHFASFDFGPGRPAQLIVGTGGDVGELADTPAIQAGQVRIDDADAERLTFDRFGYLVLDRQGPPGGAADDWAGVFYDYRDRPVADCRLHGRDLRCAPAANAR